MQGKQTRTEWNEEDKEMTREILEGIEIVAFPLDSFGKKKECPLMHLDRRNGYIRLADATNGIWRIFNRDTDEMIRTYDSISAIIDDGWKVDS